MRQLVLHGLPHIPSHQFHPDRSPSLARFLNHVDVVVAVHGYGRRDRWTDILLGGRNRALAGELASRLPDFVPGYQFVDDLASIPPELRGLHPANPVNRPPLSGVQIELPPRVRGMGPTWADWAGPGLPPPTEGLIEGLADVAQSWPSHSRAQSTSTVPPARQ